MSKTRRTQEVRIDEELKRLITKKELVIRELGRLEDAAQKGQLSRRDMENAASLQRRYEEVFIQVKAVDPDETLWEELEEFHKRCRQVLEEIDSIQKEETNGRVTTSSIQGVRLPEIQLPSFNGKSNWLSFYEAFESIINKCDSLQNVQKFQYLLSSLSGEARELIENLSITSENYVIAWDILVQRYNNKRLIIKQHVNSLIKLPIVDRAKFDLHSLENEVTKNLRILKNMGEPIEHWDTLLVEILAEKLDSSSRYEWERATNTAKVTKMSDFLNFLRERGNLIRNIKNLRTSKVVPSKSFLSTAICPVCQGNHEALQCKVLNSFSPAQRWYKVRSLDLCTNCLKKGHYSKQCKSGGCKKCGSQHHSVLHQEGRGKNREKSTEKNKVEDQKATVAAHSLSTRDIHRVMLATALVWVEDNAGRKHALRALLDSGSQSNFITKEAVSKLKLKTCMTNENIQGLGQSFERSCGKVSLKVESRINRFTSTQKFLVLKNITGALPSVGMHKGEFSIPKGIRLADPEFHKSGPIDMLLGASIFWEIMCVGQIKQGKKHPILQKTKLGWIVSGSYISTVEDTKTKQCNLALSESIEDSLQEFWRIEECNERERLLTKNEQACVDNFTKNTSRSEDGRFEVRLPFRENAPILGDSYETALKRFYQLEKRFQRSPEFKAEYIRFIEEYIELGHMIKIPKEKIRSFPYFYLPHHGILKEDSITTKLRVVFDASSRSSTGVSLNETLLVGPRLQEDLFNILLRFRKHTIAISADVEKMYRQVRVYSPHQDFQRILWRKSPEEPLGHYQLTTVTYGTASASYLATQCLIRLAEENVNEYPRASKVVMRDFYVDDLLTGGQTPEEVKRLINDINSILEKGGFRLRKWASNDPSIFNELRVSRSEVKHLLQEDENLKTLGIFWNASCDTWGYEVKLPQANARISKRNILSTISKIFDPLGLLGPVITRAKILLQTLWEAKLSWDESVTPEIHTLWRGFSSSLPVLSQISVPRQILLDEANDIQLHGFSDASERAYGACIYIRSSRFDGKCTVRLLCAKSRVAPLSKLSLPRLELCGALLLSKLVKKVINALGIKFTRVLYWSDSTIALTWIKGEPKNWKTFVCNRVAEIQRASAKDDWLHVSGKSNPADMISRGCDPQDLIKAQLWWKGPQWLAEDSSNWPKQIIGSGECKDVPERREVAITLCTISDIQPSLASSLCNKFSNLTTIQRVCAFVLRFLSNIKLEKKCRLTGPLSIEELNAANKKLIQQVQCEMFGEWQNMEDKGFPLQSNIKGLDPFLDDDKIIRVGGRLRNAPIEFGKKNPILLSHKHTFTRILIRYYHLKYHHMGSAALLCRLREKYWITSGMNAVKGIVRKCVNCFRVCPQMSSYKMGALPKERLSPTRPFLVCGVDFGGPFLIKSSKIRNARTLNVYLALFVCFSTKAVHLELVSELTSDAFIACLKRFISRRGFCTDIFSDNGLNFVGANNHLKDLRKMISSEGGDDKLQFYLNSNEIRWHFTPPRSPHFGGLWEALIKSTKLNLKRILGNVTLLYEELQTVIIEIEACLNSRPITPLSNDPNDLSALTPGHFLVGDALLALPERDESNNKITTLSKYRLLTKLKQDFWRRWSKEYITTLNSRSKWKKQYDNIKVNTMVLIQEDNVPPLRWELGRVVKIYEGHDGIARVADVKTLRGLYRRNVRRLAQLPIDYND